MSLSPASEPKNQDDQVILVSLWNMYAQQVIHISLVHIEEVATNQRRFGEFGLFV